MPRPRCAKTRILDTHFFGWRGGARSGDIPGMKILPLFLLLASVALADPAPAPAPVAGVISQDSTGYLVKAALIQHYSKLCERYPNLGDRPGDGVFVIDEDVFHLDAQHFKDYLTMLAREQQDGKVASEDPARY
jgi:hypothetical protein